MADPRSFWKADPSVWEVVIAPYLEGGDPWPREVACEDLRWLADQHRMRRRSFPSRGALARRWSWGQKKTRLLLASEDPLCQGPNEGRVGADEGPGKGRARAGLGTGKPVQSAGKDRAGAGQGPGKGRVGADEGPHALDTEHRAQNTEDREKVPPVPGGDALLFDDIPKALPAWRQAFDLAAERWGRVAYLAKPENGQPVKRTNQPPSSPTSGFGKDLASICKLSGVTTDDVLLVMDWFEQAPAADYLRDSAQKRGLDTIRRNWAKYLDMAQEWQQVRTTATQPSSRKILNRPTRSTQ